jgi:hypothetical protein
MRTRPGSVDLLSFNEAIADNRVHPRFDKGRGDPLASMIAFAIAD